MEGDTLIADALITSAQSGAYYTLLHPEFKIVNPLPEPVIIPVVYPVGDESYEFVEYVNNWSVLKDVLHWVDE